MKWSFIINVTDVFDMKISERDKEISKRVKNKARESANVIKPPQRPSVFRVNITFFQRKERWRKANPQIPREDIGRDLDNLVKPVFDALGPIIGPRKKWGREETTGKPVVVGKGPAADSNIIELTAKKVNSGSSDELKCTPVFGQIRLE